MPSTLRLSIPAALLTAALAGAALGQTELKGKIDAVTVYRGQALVTRVIDVGAGGAGLKEIVVTDLPPAIAAESLYAEADAGVEVRSVRYRQRAIAQDAREDVRKLEQEVRTLSDQLETSRAKAKQVEWQRAYLDKVENFVTGTAVVENSKGVLNAETLTKMTDHLVTQRQRLTDESRRLQLEARDIEEQLGLKQRELHQLNARGNRTAREATIFVNTPQGGGQVRVSYIVGGATWSPSYNLRAPGAAAGSVSIEYQASVQQVSGEDWTDVRMTLSTATPALVAAGPTLQPMTLALAAPTQSEIAEKLRSLGYKQAKEQAQAARDELNRARQSNVGFGNQPAAQSGAPGGGGAGGGAWDRSDADVFAGNIVLADKAINESASREQLLDFLSSETITRSKDDGRRPSPQGTEGVSVAYTLASRTSLPSRDDQQLIQIAKSECRAEFYRVATPVLSTFVYNEASVTNTGGQLLLSGPSASYSQGEFVGRGVVPTTAVGQSFVAGFGNDSSLRTSRELVDRTERTQGGNRVVEFTYRLTVENFGKEPAKVRLMDRMPATKGNDIRVELVKPGALSSDPVYTAEQKPKGILRWDVEVPAGTSADKPFAVEYTFRVEYDRQMTITEVPGK
ncbi:MAG TPA: mucoidy inhibitor MuiA family protein [Phycisphaerales bacterium]|nr:mucoidy inhibitor MuiA family protein [Phycisphaerales bacterium]